MAEMMGMRVKFGVPGRPYTMRCDYCHKSGNQLYRIRFEDGGPLYFLHPMNCFQSARKNFYDKKERGITPTMQTPPTEMPEEMEISSDDNIDQP